MPYRLDSTRSGAESWLWAGGATLRRRIAAEHERFETILSDIRMHHGMMLLQTTAWSIPRITEACGYQSIAGAIF
ncbi:MAG: hypothetical protein ACSLEN_01715 [Candidatus Malihini olakiniferum]